MFFNCVKKQTVGVKVGKNYVAFLFTSVVALFGLKIFSNR